MKKIISALLMLTMVFSMVAMSTSAATIHIDMNFDSMEAFTDKFIAGAFYVEDGLLFGYAEAKALQTKYDDSEGWFSNTLYTWLTYDASITLSIGDDELSETDRFVNLVYCNDNLVYYGREEDRYMMGFCYDVQNGRFTFGPGWNHGEEVELFLPAVEKELVTDGSEEFTLGISVQKDNIRCFYNNEMIFDYTNPDLLIASDINSPFLFWQDGNFVAVSNITIADHGTLYPVTEPTPTESEEPTPTESEEPTPTESGEPTPTESEATTAIETEIVTNEDGETEVVTHIVTEEKKPVADDNEADDNEADDNGADNKPAPDTNTGKPTGGNSTTTGDISFVVVAAMVTALGAALIVLKVSVK